MISLETRVAALWKGIEAREGKIPNALTGLRQVLISAAYLETCQQCVEKGMKKVYSI